MSRHSALPNTLKAWAREALDALEEAQAIAAEQPDFAPLDLFKMAPSIGAYYRGIDDEGLIEQMFQHACGTVVLIHEQVPEYRELPKRCFVHCYMDAMLLIKAVKVVLATPCELVTAVTGDKEPPVPLTRLNTTVWFFTGLLLTSRTIARTALDSPTPIWAGNA